MATKQGLSDIIKLLLAYGAESSTKDKVIIIFLIDQNNGCSLEYRMRS